MASIEEQVRNAASLQAALLVIAQGLDEVHVKLALANIQTVPESNSWGGWQSDNAAFVLPPSFEPTAPQYQQATPEFQYDGTLQAKQRTAIEGDTEHTEIVIPKPSAEKMALRSEFERERLHLSEHLGAGPDWNLAYAKGGPRWLYYGNRELVNSYPVATKQAMVNDVIEDSPQEAWEMGRDLLKGDGQTGPGDAAPIAEGNIG